MKKRTLMFFVAALGFGALVAFVTRSSWTSGGASAQGVTATSIGLGVLGGSSTTIGSACTRCNNGGEPTDEAVIKGLIALLEQAGAKAG